MNSYFLTGKTSDEHAENVPAFQEWVSQLRVKTVTASERDNTVIANVKNVVYVDVLKRQQLAIKINFRKVDNYFDQ